MAQGPRSVNGGARRFRLTIGRGAACLSGVTRSTILRRFAASIALVAFLFPYAAAAQDTGAGKNAAALAQDYAPSPALWRLADADTTIYLFGTIHLLPEGFAWRSAQFDAVVEQAETLVLESSEEDALASLDALAGKMAAVAEDRVPTSRRLTPDLRDRWRQLVEQNGQSFETVDRMPLALAILGFGFASADGGLSRYEYGVETVLAEEFAQNGKPVESIENHARVLLSLMRIDEAPLIRELEADLRNLPGKVANGPASHARWFDAGPDFSMEHDWARGEVAERFDLGLGSGKIAMAFNRVLLAQRNTRWSRWLEQRLEQPGTILVAVGAGHFEGPQSVLAKLAERGLKAERIN